MALPSVRTINTLNKTKKMIMGANHHFLLCLIKSQNSIKMESFDIYSPKY